MPPGSGLNPVLPGKRILPLGPLECVAEDGTLGAPRQFFIAFRAMCLMIDYVARSAKVPYYGRPPQRWRNLPVTRQPRTRTLAGELSEWRCRGHELAVSRTSPIAAERIYPNSCRGRPLVVFRAGNRDIESGCLGTAAARAPMLIAATGATTVLPNRRERASPDGP